MTGIHGQDIAEHLIGRSIAAPVPFERQQWQAWLWRGSPPDTALRDAVVTWLLDHPRAVADTVLPDRPIAHWWALLTRQLDPPAPRDLHGLRRLAGVTSFCLHLGFAALLVWVALVRSLPPAPAEEDRVALRYVSAGEGDGDPSGSEAQASEATGASSSQEAGAEDAQDVALQVDGLAMPSLPELPIPVAQAPGLPEVQVREREIEVAQSVPSLMAPPQAVDLPLMPTPSLEVMEREVVVEQVPMPVDLSRVPPRVLPIEPRPVDRPSVVVEREVEPIQKMAVAGAVVRQVADVQLPVAPSMTVQEKVVELGDEAPLPMFSSPPQYGSTGNVAYASQAVVERELSLPEAAPQVPVLNGPDMPAPRNNERVAADVVQLRERDVGSRARQRLEAAAQVRPAEQTGSGAAASPVAIDKGRAATDSEAHAAASAGQGNGESSAVASTKAPGDDWSRPASGDDWSAVGGRGGRDLFDADGRPRLPGESAAGSRGAPGSDADGWTRERLAAAGTWLKRPPYDHRPTSFEKYWVPNESLLAEWVRKGITSIAIPVPGTGTSIQCVISVLQFGGGCGLSDPNMQEQPAQARAAPDIPFKRELQQDNGSL